MRYVLFLLIAASISHGQTASARVDYPSMLILKKGVGLWECQEIHSDVSIVWPDKTTARLKAARSNGSGGDASIPATFVDGIFIRHVRACYLRGTLDDGSKFEAYLKPEPVRIKRFRVTAIGIDCPVTVTKRNGEVWTGSIWQPDCIADWISPGVRRARPVECLGSVTKIIP